MLQPAAGWEGHGHMQYPQSFSSLHFFIFCLLLDPGRKREAQSFPRENIFLQEDSMCNLQWIQFLYTTSQFLKPQAFPSLSPSVFFTFHCSCVFPPKCICLFSVSITSGQMFIHVVFFTWKIKLSMPHLFCYVLGTISPRQYVLFSRGQLDFYKRQWFSWDFSCQPDMNWPVKPW